MAEARNKNKRRHRWLWALPYAAITLLFTIVFGLFLALTVQRVVYDYDAEPMCESLLAARQQAYREIVTQVEGSKAVEALCSRNRLAVVGEMLEIAGSRGAVRDWGELRTVAQTHTLTLLDSNGAIVAGDALPEGLSESDIERMLGRTSTWTLDCGVYYTRSTALGTLLMPGSATNDAAEMWCEAQQDADSQGFAFVVGENGTVTCWPTGSRQGQPLAELTANADDLLNGVHSMHLLDGGWHYCAAEPFADGSSTIVAAIPAQTLWLSFLRRVEIPLLIFLEAALAVLLFAAIMRRGAVTKRVAYSIDEHEQKPGKAISFDRAMFPRVLAVALVGTLTLGGAAWLIFTLSGYAQENVNAATRLQTIQENADSYITNEQMDYYEFLQPLYTAANTVESGITAQPLLCEPQRLTQLARSFTVSRRKWYTGEEMYCIFTDIRLYDGKGNLLTGSGGSAEHYDAEQATLPAAYRAAVTKKPTGVLLQTDVTNSYVYLQYSEANNSIIMLSLRAPERYDAWCSNSIAVATDDAALERSHLVSCAAQTAPGSTDSVFIIQQTTDAEGAEELTMVLPGGWGDMTVEDSAALLDFDAGTLRNNFAGEQVINSQRYYINVALYRSTGLLGTQASAASITHYWMVRAVPAEQISAGLARLVPHIMLVGGVLLLLLATLCCIRHSSFAPSPQNAFTAKANRRTRTYNGHRVNGPLLGWGTVSDWNHKTAEEQFLIALGNLSLFTVAALVGLTLLSGSWRDDTVMAYILSGTWERKLNIFACTYVVVLTTACFTVGWIARILLSFVTRNLGPRSETMGALLNSVLRYASFLVALMYLLYYFGVNMSVLLASAGLLTLVLSPTLNALLGDVSAGMGIVMEDEYRVGDIVVINDFRGVVLQITLRTTRVEDLFGNVMVFNNSQITHVENRSLEYSMVPVYISVPYEESLERVQKILENELPKLTEQIPEILETPSFEGVNVLGASGVELQINFICREEFRYPTLRRVQMELKNIFDRRGITIPYTQVVLHQADDTPAEQPKAETPAAVVHTAPETPAAEKPTATASHT